MNRAVPRYFFLLIISFSILPALHAADISIRGKSMEYSGETLTFYSYSNMVSFAEKELESCVISDSGEFHCNIEVEETRLIFTRLGIFNCFFSRNPEWTMKYACLPGAIKP